MAKKKKGAVNVKISPEKYVKERARRFPIVQCKISSNWKEAGEGNIIVARQRPDGNFIIGMYLVDLYCMGVKDAFVIPNGYQEDIDNFGKHAASGVEMVDIPYEQVHNMIYGAVEFAEEAGIEPHPDFALAEYVLEEDTDDIPLIEFEYGRNGKHLLVIGPTGKERKYLSVLQKNLGNNFDFIDPLTDDALPGYPFEEGEERYGGGWSSLPYTYRHPEFPEKLSVRNRWIAEALYSPGNYYALPDDMIDRIMALPREEAVADLSAIALYELGRGYVEYDETGELTVGNDQSALLHATMLLSQLGGEKAEETVLEVMRMPFDMSDYYFSDITSEFGGAILYSVTGGDLDKLKGFLYEEGLSREIQDIVLYSLATPAIGNPERREEVIGMFREILEDMKVMIPAGNTFTDETTGFLVSVAADLNAVELLPAIKELYDMDAVAFEACGDYDEAAEEVRNGGTPESIRGAHNYRPFDVKAFYRWNHDWFMTSDPEESDRFKDADPLASVDFAD